MSEDSEGYNPNEETVKPDPFDKERARWEEVVKTPILPEAIEQARAVVGLAMKLVRHGTLDKGMQRAWLETTDPSGERHYYQVTDTAAEKAGLLKRVQSRGELTKGLQIYHFSLDANNQPVGEVQTHELPRSEQLVKKELPEFLGSIRGKSADEVKTWSDQLRVAKPIKEDVYKQAYMDSSLARLKGAKR